MSKSSQYLNIPELHTFSDQSIGTGIGALLGGSTPTSAAWPAANDAIFVPIAIPQKLIIRRLFFSNGATVAGNLDIGLYTEKGARLSSIGSSLQTGTLSIQFGNLSPTNINLSPGRYYLAAVMSNITGTSFRVNTTVARLQTLGLAKMAAAFPLPLTATFATPTSGYIPFIGAEAGAYHS